MQNKTFVGDDVRPLQGSVEGEIEVEADGEEGDSGDSGDEEELAWDDANIFKPEGPPSPKDGVTRISEG